MGKSLVVKVSLGKSPAHIFPVEKTPMGKGPMSVNPVGMSPVNKSIVGKIQWAQVGKYSVGSVGKKRKKIVSRIPIRSRSFTLKPRV